MPGVANICITYDPDDVYNLSYENINFSVQNGIIIVSANTVKEPVVVTRAENGRLELALNNMPESMLITAAYNSSQMVDSVVTYIPAGATSAIVDFQQTLPETCIYKAFVLDKTNFSPLLPTTKLTP